MRWQACYYYPSISRPRRAEWSPTSSCIVYDAGRYNWFSLCCWWCTWLNRGFANLKLNWCEYKQTFLFSRFHSHSCECVYVVVFYLSPSLTGSFSLAHSLTHSLTHAQLRVSIFVHNTKPPLLLPASTYTRGYYTIGLQIPSQFSTRLQMSILRAFAISISLTCNALALFRSLSIILYLTCYRGNCTHWLFNYN